MKGLLPAAAVVAAVLSAPPGAAAAVRLGAVVRIETPGPTPCPGESEPDVLATSAGVWVAYNDVHDCPHGGYATARRLTAVQLVPAGGGPPRHVRLDPPDAVGMLAGDPALAPDPRGNGVLLATMYSPGPLDVRLAVFRITPDLRVSRLPSPNTHPDGDNNDDKELLATDTGPRSRFRGRAYLVWDDRQVFQLTFRAFDGRAWERPLRFGSGGQRPDVAVAPDGTVAIGYETEGGVAVHTSRDGGRSFGREVPVLAGSMPGEPDPSCLGFSIVGVRQRATRAVRLAYDRAGRLHLVATVGGAARVVHAVSGDGVRWRTRRVAAAEAAQFHPNIALTPDGGVAVAWLQVTADGAAYEAYLAVAGRGGTAFGPPVRLSEAPAAFPAAMEAMGTSYCYGIGDYIGLATTPRGVVAAWPTTDATTLPYVDSDVLVREAFLR